ncbi:SusC/RagA family TonB-linked outer membrane protein [Niabella beijingensis]|uniref:SusC/RagA family TonB-linked outer membrane protein n=1 Tax=Niabella beijingensis TaxID=2872700 RepID=UPI001CC09371|nr:SusC/RagA family TonB-linked outer membrane protein [Niabella beijingensis]MBZ4188956.1 SusC/RagA family TonB-linked outer membrane protein [Niabella beijingensis]
MLHNLYKFYISVVLLFVFPVVLFAQIDRGTKNDASTVSNIEGVISDSLGTAIAGCTIQNKKNGQMTFSNKIGHFQIAASLEDSLLISHTNYLPQTIVITSVYKLYIHLIERNGLEEEVFVSSGYQRISKARTTGAFSKINEAVLREQVSPNILDRLKNVSNVYFDTKNLSDRNTNITLRGLSTINGNMAPLIVLDNFPYNGKISDINPEDVESITLLKDATAASIWGAKSANGVIVITTKKGRYDQPIAVDFSTTVSVSELPSFTKPYDMRRSDYIAVEEYLYKKGYKLSDTSSSIHPPFTPVYEMLLQKQKGLISESDSAAFIQNLLNVNTQDQYRNAFYRKAITQQYSIGLRGGGKNYTWAISGGYNKMASTLLLNNSDKKNLRLENRFKPVKGLEVGLNLFYTQTNVNTHPTPSYNSIKIGSKTVPYLSFTDAQGSPAAIDQYYRGEFIDTLGGGRLLDWHYYPLTDYRYNQSISSMQNLLMGLTINYNFLKHFNLSLNYQQEGQQSDIKEIHEKESYYTRNLINLFTMPATLSSNPLTYNIPLGDILNRSSQKRLARYGRVQLSYQNAWEEFNYTGFTGAEVSETKLYNQDASTYYGYKEDPLSFATLSFNTYYPTYIDGSLQFIPGAPKLNSSNFNRFISGFMNHEFTFKQRYIINASLRSDASNLFGLSANDKWNPFWSGGVAWNIANESFFSKKVFSFFKLRATIGIGGNVDPTRTALPVATSWNDPVTNYYSLNIFQINNPSLKWEQSRQINFGADFEILNQRISGSADFYLKKGTNLYGPSSIDYTAWGKTNTVIKNVAAMKGSGIELSLQSKNLTGPFVWTSSLLFNYNQSTTTDYYQSNASNVYYFILSGGEIAPVVGKPLYAIAAYKWGGLDSKGDPQGYINGELSTDYDKIRESAYNGDQSGIVYIGQQDPKFFGALNNSFGYKSWQLSFNLSYKLGHYFQRPALNYNTLYATGTGNSEYENRWQQPADETRTNVPAMVYTDYPSFSGRDAFYTASEISYLRADHVRLEYINLGYSFPHDGKGHSFFKELSVNSNITNLGIIWRKNKEHLDPDYYYTNMPPRQYSLSLRATF